MNNFTERGFTLLELIVVLIIVSLMSAVVGPSVAGSLSKMNLKTAAKKTAASLRYARSRAVAENTIYIARFDFEQNRLLIISGFDTPNKNKTGKNKTGKNKTDKNNIDEKNTEKSKRYVLPVGVRFKKGILAEDEVDSGLFDIVFSPGGSSSGGGVVLADERGKEYEIGVDFVTGAVHGAG